MKLANWIRKVGRPLIFPEKEVLNLISGYKFQKALDVGCGDGKFLDTLITAGFAQQAIGVETDDIYWGESKEGAKIVGPSILTGKYDCIIFNDVLHHVDDKKKFIYYYINKYCDAGGVVLIKDMSPEKIIPKYFNRLHDFVLAHQIIQEIDCLELVSLMKPDFQVVAQGKKQVFLYDHYYMIFEKNESF